MPNVMVRMLTSRKPKGKDYQFAGDTPIVTDAEAAEMVRIGHAEIVETAALMPHAETRHKRGKGNYR